MHLLVQVLLVLGTIIGSCIIVLPLVIWHANTHSYICRKCGHEFSISVLKDLVSPHKLLKCPNCYKWAWQKEIKKIK
ncbi:MAG: hypothetical protein H7Y18_03530 [Clostridiaceae bacterium]|nr:hypothetical protein [Clostridiaceae bacterium]